METAETSLEAAIKDILFIPRLVGSYPLGRDYKLSWGLIVFIIDFVLNTIFSISRFINSKKDFPACFSFFLYIIQLHPPLINFESLYFNSERIKDLYGELLAFEKFTHRNGVRWIFRYRCYRKYLRLLVVLNSVISILFISEMKYIWNVAAMLNSLHYYISFLTIADLISGTTSILVSAIAHLKFIREDRQLLSKFDRLVFLRRTIEDVFGRQILAIIAMSFVLAVSNVCLFIIDRFGAAHAAGFFLLSMYPMMAIYVPLLSIISQAKKIDKLLYRRLLANPDDELLEFHMIAKRDVSFTAFGFFRINSSLISSMIGAGTTYFVILLQYGK